MGTALALDFFQFSFLDDSDWFGAFVLLAKEKRIEMNLIFLLLLSISQGGVLRIASEANLQLERKGSEVELVGTYSMHNQGDDFAKDVWPEFQLDQYQWRGGSQSLPAGEKFTWEIRELIPQEQFCLQVSDHCPVALPLRGQFLLSVQKHYQDPNGYIFVVPDFEILSMGSGESDPYLKLSLMVQKENAVEFMGHYGIQNQSDPNLQVQIQWLLPKEVESLTQPSPFEVPGKGEVSGSFQFQNRSGLPGSTYVAILTAAWEQDGARLALAEVSKFEIESHKVVQPFFKQDRKILSWILWFTMVGLILMWLFWIRPLRKFSKW